MFWLINFWKLINKINVGSETIIHPRPLDIIYELHGYQRIGINLEKNNSVNYQLSIIKTKSEK